MVKRTLKTIFFLSLLLSSYFLLAQQREYITGKLLDAKTQEPIVFASIRIKDRALGVISNVDGSFKIPLRYKEYGHIIEISSMGYQSKEVLIYDLSMQIVNILRLQPAVFELEEAVVSAKSKREKYMSAKRIVRKAIEAIPKNFPETSFSTVGYYRDYQLKKGEYLNLNEAILEVFDTGFDESDDQNTKVRIYDYKQNTDFERDTEADDRYNYSTWKKVIQKAYLFDYGGNEFTILRVHDAIRNYEVDSYDFVNRLKTDLLNNHSFNKEADTYTEDEVLYTIKFVKRLSDFRLYGRFYISKRDFAIHKMEYAMYDNLKWNVSNELNKHNNKNQLIFEVVTEYKRKYNKLFLNYISFQNRFQLSRPPEFIVKEIVAIRSQRCFEVRFNRDVDPASGGNKRNYDFRYKGKRIKFKRVIVTDEAVWLYPDMGTIETDMMLGELANAARRGLDLSELLETWIQGIRDFNPDGEIYSVLLDERKKEDYRQFREFFVQQVKPDSKAPVDTLFMNKRKPIFKDQPIVKPDNFDEYWMNTPLQNVKN